MSFYSLRGRKLSRSSRHLGFVADSTHQATCNLLHPVALIISASKRQVLKDSSSIYSSPLYRSELPPTPAIMPTYYDHSVAMHPASSPLDYRGYSDNCHSTSMCHSTDFSLSAASLRSDFTHSALPYRERIHDYKPNPSAPLFQPQQPYSTSNFARSQERREHAFSGPLPSIHSYYQPQLPAFEPAAQQPKPKEESAGGLVKHLDYDLQVMTDFLFESTISMYVADSMTISGMFLMTNNHHSMKPVVRPVSQDYREWIRHVLSATRLPSTTIYLALNYLSKRIELYSTRTLFGQTIDVKRMFIVSLILASKYADDSTFINRSWAEVAKIDVKVINFMEADWLQLIGWRLDVKVNPGWEQWRDEHREYVLKRKLEDMDRVERSTGMYIPTLPRLNQLNTNLPPLQPIQTKAYALSAYPSMPDLASASLSRRIRSHQEASYSAMPISYDPWNQPRNVSDGFSPDSAPYTGPNTPEYYTGSSGWQMQQLDARSLGGFQGWTHPQQTMAGQATFYPQQYVANPKYDEYANVWNSSTPAPHVHSNMNPCSQCPSYGVGYGQPVYG